MFIHETKYRRDGEEYKPTYVCDKCGVKITEYRPKRLALQEYDKKYNTHQSFEKVDLCKRCYFVFDKWLKTKPKSKIIDKSVKND